MTTIKKSSQERRDELNQIINTLMYSKIQLKAKYEIEEKRLSDKEAKLMDEIKEKKKKDLMILNKKKRNEHLSDVLFDEYLSDGEKIFVPLFDKEFKKSKIFSKPTSFSEKSTEEENEILSIRRKLAKISEY